MNLANSEQKAYQEMHEEAKITTGVFTVSELQNLVYKDNFVPQDIRFASWKDGGSFKYFNADDLLMYDDDSGVCYPYVKVGDDIVGLAKLMPSMYDPTGKTLAIAYVSVDPAHQGKHYSTKLAETIVAYAKEQNKKLKATPYSEEGFTKLKSVFEKLTKYHGVEFIDRVERL